MKHPILFPAAVAMIAGLGLFSFARTAGADIKPPIIQQKTAETLRMRITAYASVPDETSVHPFITASGEYVRDGIVASNILPFGTKIEIPTLFGDKIFTVEDRMNRRFQNTIDIWMSSKLAATDFGVAHTSVVVLGEETSSAISEAAASDKVTL
jgi:3D (Asp-Asp-Asp) domain-containing protein